MAGPILSHRSYAEVSGQTLAYRSGSLRVVYPEFDVNDSDSGTDDVIILGPRRRFEVNLELIAKEEVDPHSAPLSIAKGTTVSFKLFESEASNPYECTLLVREYEVGTNPGDGSPVTRRIVGRSTGSVLLPGET